MRGVTRKDLVRARVHDYIDRAYTTGDTFDTADVMTALDLWGRADRKRVAGFIREIPGISYTRYDKRRKIVNKWEVE